MKKLFCLFAILFLGITILTSCSNDKDKPLIVACAASTSPYCNYTGDNNAPVAGIDIDLVNEIGKELGRPVQIKFVPFQYIFTLISREEADIGAAGITITPEHSEGVLISSPYDTSSQVIVVPNGSAIKNESALKTARVAVQEGASDIELLRETVKPEAVLPFLTLEEVNAAFENRRADAAVLDAMQADSLIKENKDKYKILGKPLSRHQYGLVFNKEKTKLAAAANEVIEKLKADGTLRKSRAEHFDALNTIPPARGNEDEGKPFIVCLESSFAPFVLMNKNQLAGMDIEIAKEIASELKRPLRFKIVPFTEVLPLVENGSADMGASGISITPEREKAVLFSQPYAKTLRRVLVNTDAAYAKLDDLKGKVIGAKKGTKSEDFAVDELQAEKTVHFDNAMQGILGLLDHKIDAYVDDDGEADLASEKIASLDGRKVKMLDITIPLEEYGFAFQINNTLAKAAADKVIDTKRLRGEINALFRKYTSIYMTLDMDNR
ncbi:MAG: amino acid ABC transporter substrate-binding protein [Lentisphaeria bacterium]|nr:amino acid ABC transporter substrate-binding protein [Lentisphaeria bacterium]